MVLLGRMGLRKKTFIYVGAGLGALMILLALLSLWTINQAIDLIYQERLALVENIALDIDNIIEHLRIDIVDFTQALGQGWQDNPTDSYKDQVAAIQRHLRQDLVSFRLEQAVFVAVVDARGKILWTEPYLAQKTDQSLADTAAIQEVVESGQVYVEVEESLLTQDSPTLSILAPIKDDQEVMRGVLIVDMPVLPGNGGFGYFLRSRLANYDLELVTGSGLVLASSRPEQALEESSHWEVIRLLAQQRLSGIKKYTRPETGEEPHMVTFAPLAQVPWGVILVQPEEQVLELPLVMRRSLLMMSGLVLLVAVGLIWGFTQQIVSPLRRLAATAQRLGAGDLEAQVPAMAQNEIGRLAENLDTMRRRLKHSLDEIRQWNQELEQRVRQRTNELEGLYQQLSERDKERGDLLGKIISVQEEERRRIARELHDEVSQTLTGLVMSLGSTEALLVRNPAVRQRLESLRGLTSDAVEEVRRLIRDLRPSLLDDLGLVAAIGWYVENYLAPAGVKAKLETHGLSRRLPPNVEITLFRVVQEAVTNIVKHARAKIACIRLQLTPSAIVGSIEDDGVGFDVDNLYRERAKSMVFGLLGMEERIKLLEGKLSIESHSERGTKVHFEIPWQESNGGKNSRSDS